MYVGCVTDFCWCSLLLHAIAPPNPPLYAPHGWLSLVTGRHGYLEDFTHLSLQRFVLPAPETWTALRSACACVIDATLGMRAGLAEHLATQVSLIGN